MSVPYDIKPRFWTYEADRWLLEPDTEEEKALFRKDHGAMLKHAKANESVLMMVCSLLPCTCEC